MSQFFTIAQLRTTLNSERKGYPPSLSSSTKGEVDMTKKKARKKPTEKEIILQVSDTVRIIQSDRINVEVQRLETNYLPRKKEEVSNYQFKGFYSTVVAALKGIQHKELLVDYSDIKTLSQYLAEIKLANEMVLDALDMHKGERT